MARSNTIILMSDEHNPFYSSVFEHPIVQTPNMKLLAEQGTVYRHAYCLSPLCIPSRSAFMTGKRVHELQTYSNVKVNLDPNRPSFGQALSEQGIHTVLIGNSGYYSNGFSEEFYTNKAAKKKKPDVTLIMRQPLPEGKGRGKRAQQYGVREDAFDRDLVKVDTAIQWIKEKGARMQQPWVLVINVSSPHFPLWNTKEFWEMYADGGDMPAYDSTCDSAQHPYAQDLRSYFETDTFTEEQVRGLRRGYYGNVSFVDRQLGRIMQTMEETGLQDHTNLIYTADHGEMLGKFGLWWKCNLYEDAVRIPCIASGPDFQSDCTVDTPVDLLDVQASLFEITGVPLPEGRYGTPLQHILKQDKERVVFAEYHGHGTRSGSYMIRKGDWKLIYYMKAEHQLFHLAEDPNELVNVFKDHPDKAAELVRELRYICDPKLENEKAHAFQAEQIRAVTGTAYNLSN